jgi:hypothetical protein
MKKLAVLIMMIVSLVITPVMAGTSNHAFRNAKSESAISASNQQLQSIASADHSKQSEKQQTPGGSHMHCCAAHMAAMHTAGSEGLAPFPVIKDRAVGLWKEARYSSLNVGPLLEPPAHA